MQLMKEEVNIMASAFSSAWVSILFCVIFLSKYLYLFWTLIWRAGKSFSRQRRRQKRDIKVLALQKSVLFLETIHLFC